jgi:hypothetical protein
VRANAQKTGVPSAFPIPPASKAPSAADAATCPALAFGQASTVTMISSESDSSGSVAVLYRQTDGNSTAQGFAIANGVATKTGSLPHAQDLFVSCRGIAPWTPAPRHRRWWPTAEPQS